MGVIFPLTNRVHFLTDRIKFCGKRCKSLERKDKSYKTDKQCWLIVKHYNVTIQTFLGGITTYMFVDSNWISCVIDKFQLSCWQGNHISHFRGALAVTPNIGVIYLDCWGNLPQYSGVIYPKYQCKI